jgi:hypothetical protein
MLAPSDCHLGLIQEPVIADRSACRPPAGPSQPLACFDSVAQAVRERHNAHLSGYTKLTQMRQGPAQPLHAETKGS